MSLEGEPQERRGETRAVKTYPLNSRRLTARIVHRIAAALELPKAPLSDARQMVEGSLGEGREPWSVQVDIVESESGSIIRLRDADGVFLEVPQWCRKMFSFMGAPKYQLHINYCILHRILN